MDNLGNEIDLSPVMAPPPINQIIQSYIDVAPEDSLQNRVYTQPRFWCCPCGSPDFGAAHVAAQILALRAPVGHGNWWPLTTVLGRRGSTQFRDPPCIV